MTGDYTHNADQRYWGHITVKPGRTQLGGVCQSGHTGPPLRLSL
jgi:hypothetical protein